MVPGQQLVLEHSGYGVAYQCSLATRGTAHCYSNQVYCLQWTLWSWPYRVLVMGKYGVAHVYDNNSNE